MAKNSAVNLDITNNADGYDVSGGTTKRKLTVTGADITLTGAGSNTYTFPSVSDTITGYSWDGWAASGETWTYAGADDPTFTFTIAGVDLTGKYSPGMKIKLTQTSVKYFIITKVEFSTNTTVTVYGGTDYDLTSATISNTYYSMMKAPVGFPLDQSKWTITVISNSSNAVESSATQNIWYNVGGSGSIPIGQWNIIYNLVLTATRTNNATTAFNASCYGTLSTTNNSESNADLTIVNTQTTITSLPNAAYSMVGTYPIVFIMPTPVVLTTKTTVFLNARSTSSGTLTNIGFRGDVSPTTVYAVCSYL